MVSVWIQLNVVFTFCVFRLFFFLAREQQYHMILVFYCVGKKILFMHCLCTIHGSHNTIHTFKNYFATLFSVSVKISSFQMDPYNNPIKHLTEQRILPSLKASLLLASIVALCTESPKK